MTELSRDPSRPLLADVLGMLGRIPRRLSSWRVRRRASPLWTVAVAAIVAVMLLPILTVLVLSLFAVEDTWPHLVENVLPRALFDTLALMIGVGVVTSAVGTAAAWTVTMYRFPGRAVVDRLLVIPLAVPTYIVALCYVELFDYAGPVQSAFRDAFGWRSPGDYWFPDIRSLGGAVFMLSMVLYPYVYLSARASFVQQSVCVLEVARTLGRTPTGTFLAVALPLARPAIAAGAALALMECLNDLGAVQYLGVQTLSVSVYSTWLLRSNLGGAAQIAAVMLVFVALLFALERVARGGAQYHHTTGRYRAIPFSDIDGWRGWLMALCCVLPFLAGFVLPCLVLVRHALEVAPTAVAGGFLRTAANSIVLAALAALVTILLALLLAYARRVAANGFTRPAVALAGLGYALPGTVLALGLLIPLAALDNQIDAAMRSMAGIGTGLLLSGSIAALVIAYSIRFAAVALGSVEAGLNRISPNLDAAARTLGTTALATLWRVHLPLLIPALGAAALLVFVDGMKELPATLLLRPFNFETLATEVYAFAALERVEEAAFGALAIVAVGLVPVLLLHEAIARGRSGGAGG
jgi:iron(III) transport system permease protein